MGSRRRESRRRSTKHGGDDRVEPDDGRQNLPPTRGLDCLGDIRVDQPQPSALTAPNSELRFVTAEIRHSNASQLQRSSRILTRLSFLTTRASASSNELAKYVEFLKEENKILRARVPRQIHTKPDERSRLIKFGKAAGRAVEELLTIVAPQTFYRWCREEDSGKKKANPKGGQRKPREIRELMVEIATTTSFGYCYLNPETLKGAAHDDCFSASFVWRSWSSRRVFCFSVAYCAYVLVGGLGSVA